jgi:hypothetical protein
MEASNCSVTFKGSLPGEAAKRGIDVHDVKVEVMSRFARSESQRATSAIASKYTPIRQQLWIDDLMLAIDPPADSEYDWRGLSRVAEAQPILGRTSQHSENL